MIIVVHMLSKFADLHLHYWSLSLSKKVERQSRQIGLFKLKFILHTWMDLFIICRQFGMHKLLSEWEVSEIRLSTLYLYICSVRT